VRKMPSTTQVKEAVEMASKGNLSKAFALLCTAEKLKGSSEHAATQLQLKHPPPTNPEPLFVGRRADVERQEFKCVEREAMARKAIGQKPGIACDQWGW